MHKPPAVRGEPSLEKTQSAGTCGRFRRSRLSLETNVPATARAARQIQTEITCKKGPENQAEPLYSWRALTTAWRELLRALGEVSSSNWHSSGCGERQLVTACSSAREMISSCPKEKSYGAALSSVYEPCATAARQNIIKENAGANCPCSPRLDPCEPMVPRLVSGNLRNFWKQCRCITHLRLCSRPSFHRVTSGCKRS